MVARLVFVFLCLGSCGYLDSYGIVVAQEASEDSKPLVQKEMGDTDKPRIEGGSGKQQGGKNANQTMVQQWLRQMDKNKDQRIAWNESSGLMRENFARVDSNSDGFLKINELAALAQRLVRNRGNRNRGNPRQRGNAANEVTDEQVRRSAGDQIACELNVPYREGHERWKLDLFRPVGEVDGLRPALVFVHGGGWIRGDKRKVLFLEQAIDSARRGYVCITVNYRLDASRVPCIKDVKCAVRWLRAHADDYQIDPQRIGAYGNSAGAHLVSMLGVSASNRELEGDGPFQDYSSQIQAVAASATPTRPMRRGEANPGLAAVAPITYVTKDAPPFLLFHEVSDRLVDIGHSDDFVKALTTAGATDVTYRRMTDGSGHAVFQKNRNAFQNEMASFFARTLRGKELARSAE